MPIKKLPDNGGATLTVVDVDGYYFPVFNLKNLEEDLRSISGWQARNGDLMICAYPKSGTHWIWEVASMLVKKRAERIPFNKDTAMIELTAHGNITSPRVLNSHVF
ncbi:Estrogen sulfotransferase [Mizuhopecten yessoensis]|uniref:Estrogen sulfotransferase n=1 Tax=Mizuhopecten yessoensis TaxID=6573 RepID=A0A210PQ80_MIZYE|nr:Estrogen sulfotransferase [Mizuhopecten yessoensis]